jgi:hypothetical protein
LLWQACGSGGVPAVVFLRPLVTDRKWRVGKPNKPFW